MKVKLHFESSVSGALLLLVGVFVRTCDGVAKCRVDQSQLSLTRKLALLSPLSGLGGDGWRTSCLARVRKMAASFGGAGHRLVVSVVIYVWLRCLLPAIWFV